MNEEKQLVVAKLLEQIGENAGKLSKSFREKHPEVSWKRFIKSRQHLVHVYEDVLMNTVWDTVTEQIPKLLTGIEVMIREVVDTAAKKE